MNQFKQFKSEKRKTAAAVFIHGIFGKGSTWGSLINYVREDSVISNNYHLRTFDYPTPYICFNPFKRIPDLSDLADRLATFLSEDVNLKYCSRIVLIGHSQGGLVIQKFLADQLSHGKGENLRRIQGVIMLATPNTGSELFISARKKIEFIWPHPQEKTLRPKNKEIDEMRKIILEQVIYASVNSTSTCPIPFQVYAGESDGIVPAKSAKSFFPRAGTLPGDHFTIIKPKSKADLICTSIINFLRQSWDSFHSDGLIIQTCALNPQSKVEIDTVMKIQNEKFPPSACIKRADLEYWLQHYEESFSIHLRLIIAKVGENIHGYVMFHEHTNFIIVDYIITKPNSEVDTYIKSKMLARLIERAQDFDVPVIFEVEDPSFLIGEDSNRAKGRIRLFEQDGSRVIQGLSYLAPHMERFGTPGQEEKYLLMYARPGKMPNNLIQSEVIDIIKFLYGVWYRNWFSRTLDSASLDKYLNNLITKVTKSIPEKCLLQKYDNIN